MKVQLCCSSTIEDKLNKQLMRNNISIDEESTLALVEKGYDLPEGKLIILFDAIDYMEAFELLLMKQQHVKESSEELIPGYFEDRYTLIRLEDILFIEAFGSEVSCVVVGKHYALKKPLYHYENLFALKGLIRINKSQLVNLMNVIEIIPWFNSRLVMSLKNGTQLEVSKKYAKDVRKLLDI